MNMTCYYLFSKNILNYLYGKRQIEFWKNFNTFIHYTLIRFLYDIYLT